MGISRRLILAGLALTPAAFSASAALAARPAPTGPIKPSNELEKRLVALTRKRTAASLKAFQDCFLTAELYVVTTPGGMAAARRGMNDGSPVAIWRGPLLDGRHGVAVFTSLERMTQSFYEEDDVPYLTMKGRDTLDLAVGGPLVVNYGLRQTVFIEPDEAKSWQALA